MLLPAASISSDLAVDLEKVFFPSPPPRSLPSPPGTWLFLNLWTLRIACVLPPPVFGGFFSEGTRQRTWDLHLIRSSMRERSKVFRSPPLNFVW